MFNLELTNRFVRSYKKLDRAIRLQVDKTLQVMVINPSHTSLRLKRVQGTKDNQFPSSLMTFVKTIITGWQTNVQTYGSLQLLSFSKGLGYNIVNKCY